MNRRTLPPILALLFAVGIAAAAEEKKPPPEEKDTHAEKVYGEWRIHIQPNRGTDYGQLIERQGLPLFREAGGRMVGWWTTAVGDLYEQTTIWEYDDMAAFERAIAMLGKDERFARFVAARDPLLVGESNRFLRLARGAVPPPLPESAAFVVHERHHVALARQRDYLQYMTGPGRALLERHGFHLIGPWTTDVGDWAEITWLFTFDSLAQRERLMARFAADADAAKYAERLNQFAHEIVTRVLAPAKFAHPSDAELPTQATSLLPHLERVAPNVYVAGFADRYGSANCGWFAGGDETWLVDLPRGVSVPDYLAVVAKTCGAPATRLVLTQWQTGDEVIVRSLLDHGVTSVTTSAALAERLVAGGGVPAGVVRICEAKTSLGDGAADVELIPCDGVASQAGAALYLAGRNVLFAGPLVTHGPRAPLTESDTALWQERLAVLRHIDPAVVVPGRGSWGGPERLERQALFLSELRRQIGYTIAQGRPLSALPPLGSVLLADLAWAPYDGPTNDDLEHVYRELTVPHAPFGGHPPTADDRVAHALVLIGDQPHEPGHIEDGLRPAFAATGIVPHFAVDVRALSAENLAHVKLLVILRDGLQRPVPTDGEPYVWMTEEQQHAVVGFVEQGGGFLNLHNSMGLYPDQGPYLNLVGGAYTGHGPLERFCVEVVDREHPVTRGVSKFFVADEQHAPTYDETKVHLLLQSRSDEGQTAAAGWTREPGRGRLCHLASGHTRESLLHPMYQRLLRNAMQWCLRREPKADDQGS
ncbi:MAG TPA: ThuA domain-containing protein [Pirellulales bacterium]|nr:ThuA domain-containing protein [Pirellulales bacterium]